MLKKLIFILLSILPLSALAHSPIANLIPNDQPKEVNGINISILNIITSSGLILKHDPGVPIVYIGFAISLIGSVLSIISTNQIWIITEDDTEEKYRKCV